MDPIKRSFKVLGAYDDKNADVAALLADSRLEIDALKGRPCQAGARAGSQLYRTRKCKGKKLNLPLCYRVMLQETTRGSACKRFAYEVLISPVKKCNRPTNMAFKGTFQSTATKMLLCEFDALKKPPAKVKAVRKPAKTAACKKTASAKPKRKPAARTKQTDSDCDSGPDSESDSD
jgi:hypothetical protein